MSNQINKISNNNTVHRIAVLILVPISLIIISIDSIWSGITWFWSKQVSSFSGLFYETYVKFSYCWRKYMNRKFWNW